MPFQDYKFFIMHINIINKIFRELEKSVSFVPVVNKLSEAGSNPFRILITTMLSSRTRDEVTELASARLFKLGQTPGDFAKLPRGLLGKTIFPVGFYKTKAGHITGISRALIENYNGSVPPSLDELLKLPGVGIKTASLVLAEGFGQDEICVDTHVHRISNRIGMVKTSSPEKTRLALKKVLPVGLWKKINRLFVSHGKTICRPVGPKCGECAINRFCQTGIKALL